MGHRHYRFAGWPPGAGPPRRLTAGFTLIELPAVRKGKRAAFTLIELLVVIAIIMLLMAITIPTVGKIMEGAQVARIKQFIIEVDEACQGYYLANNNYYPGQADVSSWSGTYTGSQICAARLFGYPYGNINDATPTTAINTAGSYLSYKEGRLLSYYNKTTTVTYQNCLADLFDQQPRALCYYPARLGASGLSQYVYADNEGLMSSTEGRFQLCITDNRYGDSNMPYHPGRFLLVAAGPIKDGKRRFYYSGRTLYTNFGGGTIVGP